MAKPTTSSDEKDRFGEKIRAVGKVREDQWAANNERDLMAKMRTQVGQSEASGDLDKPAKSVEVFKNILCAIDFEDCSLAALRLARQIALQNGSIVYLMNVRQTMTIPMGGEVTNPPLSDAAVRARLRALASEHLEGIRHRELVSAGDPAKVLLKTAESLKPNIIVMGTHGREGVYRLLLGSVAEKILRGANCPVLTTKGK